MAYTQIAYEAQAEVALITLNRPEKLNAWTRTMSRELVDAITTANDDTAIGAIVVTGAGRGFCAGADQRLPPGSDVVGGGELEGPQSLMRIPYLLHTMPKPTIAMVNGATAGGGMGLALACDIRIASEQAKFTSAFRNVGIGRTTNSLMLMVTPRIIILEEEEERLGIPTVPTVGF